MRGTCLILHQLSVKLLGIEDPDEVVRCSLELLQHRTGAVGDRLSLAE